MIGSSAASIAFQSHRDGYEAGKAEGLAQGTSAERARIVAWLREKSFGLYGAYKNLDAKRYAAIADEIERGERP